MINKSDFFEQYPALSRQLSKSALLLLQYFITDPERLMKSQKDISADIGKCRATVNRSITVLVELQYIEYSSKFDRRKYTCKNVTPISKPATVRQVEELSDKDYNNLLLDYLRTYDKEQFEKTLEKYPDKYDDMLESCKTCLPDNIDELAVKHGFEKELLIVKDAVDIIEQLGDKFEYMGFLEIGDNYRHRKDFYKTVMAAMLGNPLTYKQEFGYISDEDYLKALRYIKKNIK